MTLAEASDKLGGQFRLAGLQPRRAQITDFLDWLEGQLQRLQVEVRRNTYLDADEIAGADYDTVILATGSSPTETPTQRYWPQAAADAALRGPHVWPAEAVMAREARLGKRVLVLDEGGNYKGVGTAWHLAEAGHQVTIVTPDPQVGKELVRTAVDGPVRMRLAKLGAKFLVESALADFKDGKARIVEPAGWQRDRDRDRRHRDRLDQRLQRFHRARACRPRGWRSSRSATASRRATRPPRSMTAGAPAWRCSMLWLDAEAVRHFGDFRRLVPAIQEMNRDGTDRVDRMLSRASRRRAAGRTTG